jgi:hypothetical protein
MEEEASRAGPHSPHTGGKDHANRKNVAAPVDSDSYDEKCVDAQVKHTEPSVRVMGGPIRIMNLVGDLDNDESFGAILRDVGLVRSSLPFAILVEERGASHPLWEDIECIELRSSKFREYTMILHGERRFFDIIMKISRMLPYVFTHTPRGEQDSDGRIATTDYHVTREALVAKQHLNPVMKVSACSVGSEFYLPDEQGEDYLVETKIFHCDLPPATDSRDGLNLYPENSDCYEREDNWHDYESEEVSEDDENHPP